MLKYSNAKYCILWCDTEKHQCVAQNKTALSKQKHFSDDFVTKTHKQYAIFLNLRFPPRVFPYSSKVLLRKAFSHAAWQSDSSSAYYTSSLIIRYKHKFQHHLLFLAEKSKFDATVLFASGGILRSYWMDLVSCIWDPTICMHSGELSNFCEWVIPAEASL